MSQFEFVDQFNNIKSVANFSVFKKHPWRGKYKRIFCIGENQLFTRNVSRLSITNVWIYSQQVIDVKPISSHVDAFLLTTKNGHKTSILTFVSKERAALLSYCNRYRESFCSRARSSENKSDYFLCEKLSWNRKRVSANLCLTTYSINQIHLENKTITKNYFYKDINKFFFPYDNTDAIIFSYGSSERLHFYFCSERENLVKKVFELALTFIGIEIPVETSGVFSLKYLYDFRFGPRFNENELISYSNYTVRKISEKHLTPIERVLCITEDFLVERDPFTYNIISIKPLNEVYCLNRDEYDEQKFSIEYIDGSIRRYYSFERDSLLVSLLDISKTNFSRNYFIKITETNYGARMAPLSANVDEGIELFLLRSLSNATSIPEAQLFSLLELFNNNIHFQGRSFGESSDDFFSERKEKLILSSITTFLSFSVDSLGPHHKDKNLTDEQNIKQNTVIVLFEKFHALSKLLSTRVGFQAFTLLTSFNELFGTAVLTALKLRSCSLSYAVFKCIGLLMRTTFRAPDAYQEHLNKSFILSNKKFLKIIVKVFNERVQTGSGLLVVHSLLNFFVYSVGERFSATTPESCFDTLISLMAESAPQSLFKLLQHPAPAFVKGSGQLMKALIEEGSPNIVNQIRRGSLTECAILQHLITAIFTRTNDFRSFVSKELSCQLLELWVGENPEALDLLSRIFPSGLLRFLHKESSASEKNFLLPSKKTIENNQSENNSAAFERYKKFLLFRSPDKLEVPKFFLRNSRKKERSFLNFPLLFKNIKKNHRQPDLIWDSRTREELREQLEHEYHSFLSTKSHSSCNISWNYLEFEVEYKSLINEIRIGEHYLSVLLNEPNVDSLKHIHNPTIFFQELYHNFLLISNEEVKLDCLQAMTIVYQNFYNSIGCFKDLRYVILMIENSQRKVERDRLLLFVKSLMSLKENAKLLVESRGLSLLVELSTLAHLHTERTSFPAPTNFLMNENQPLYSEKEWYYSLPENKIQRLGPVTLKELQDLFSAGTINKNTLCWAQGLEKWKPVEQITQLKWLFAGVGILNDIDLALLCINILSKVSSYYPNMDVNSTLIRPVPRVKKILTNAFNLPLLSQLLLTFEPLLVETTAYLLLELLNNNPALPNFYATGAFLFALMYPGSNILSLCHLFYDFHTKQSHRLYAKPRKFHHSSILYPLLPEAMIRFLHNHGPHKFSELFLGDHNNPEVIWNKEMRTLMISRIDSHLSYFIMKLKSNVCSPFQYFPMPKIFYPPLENELFCNQYYLRSLCDQSRFPGWPVHNPVEFLRDLLAAWSNELSKKEPLLTKKDCLTVLGLEDMNLAEMDETLIRRAYFRMAAKYHPDKNPSGREEFEKVAEAYEFLSNFHAENKESYGPNLYHISLYIKSQTLLFCRYSEALAPYKYAGYIELLKVISQEILKKSPLESPHSLLYHSSELLYNTVKTSPLNVEELRRENGIDVLASAFLKVFSFLQTSIESLAFPVAEFLLRTFAVTASFKSCRAELKKYEHLIQNFIECLNFKEYPNFTAAALQCFAELFSDPELQNIIYKRGGLHHILLFLFDFDVTCANGSANHLPLLAAQALSKLLANQSNPTTCVLNFCERLFSPSMCPSLTTEPLEFLISFNSNIYTPSLLWNSSNRRKLRYFLETSISNKNNNFSLDGDQFDASLHDEPLKIDGIYVEVYNEDSSFKLNDPESFVTNLIKYLYKQHIFLSKVSMGAELEQNNINSEICAVLKALENVLKANEGLAESTIGHSEVLLSFITYDFPEIQEQTLSLLQLIVRNENCIVGMMNYYFISRLTLLLDHPKTFSVMALLQSLLSNNQVVSQCFSCGCFVVLLHIFASSAQHELRVKAALLLLSSIKNKVYGQKVVLIVEKFLPVTFIEVWRENIDSSVVMFDKTHENPELIWNDKIRQKVKDTLLTMKEEIYKSLQEENSSTWDFPESFQKVYLDNMDELMIGGVYVRLFNEHRGWPLRAPREFLIGCLEKFLELCGQPAANQSNLQLLGQGITKVVTLSSGLMDTIAPLGHIRRLIGAILDSKAPYQQRECYIVLSQLSESQSCVNAMTEVTITSALRTGMQSDIANIEPATKTLYNIMLRNNFTKPPGKFLKEALKQNFILFLLDVLNMSLVSASSKVYIVKSIKEMLKDEIFGEELQKIVELKPIWAQYKDQLHDLFISKHKEPGFLLDGETRDSQYLMDSTTIDACRSPPPLDLQ